MNSYLDRMEECADAAQDSEHYTDKGQLINAILAVAYAVASMSVVRGARPGIKP